MPRERNYLMAGKNNRWIYGGIVSCGLAVLVLQLVSSRPSFAQEKAVVAPPSGGSLEVRDISLGQAQKVLEAAISKAQAMNTKMDVAIVDAGGNLKAFSRMDGAWIGSIDIAIKKAKTARMFDMPTGEIGKLSQPGQPLYMIEMSNGGLITFPGGVPIRDDKDMIIGAIGVSGSSVENDHAVAAAGASALK